MAPVDPPMTFGSLFSGVGGFELGLERSGLRCLFQVEREPFCLKVLDRHWPDVPKFTDVCEVGASNLPAVDWLVGGFPCQDVSVAGKREGLSGARTGLFWEFLRIASELNVKGLILENVPGLLTSHRGRDFHTVLSALAERGFRRSYRILDSQHFRIAQRRRRVFLVCGARGLLDGAAEVLFESTRGGGNSSSSRSERESLTGPLGGGAYGTGRRDEDDPNLVTPINMQVATRHKSLGRGTGFGAGEPGDAAFTIGANHHHAVAIAATLRGRSHGVGVNMPGRGGEDDQNLVCGVHANQRGELRTSALAGSLTSTRSGKQFEGVAYALRADPGGIGQGHNTNFIAATLNSGGNSGGFRTEPGEHLIASSRERARALTSSMHKRHDEDTDTLIAPTLQSKTGRNQIEEVEGYQVGAGVRRLTPLECERLQGFPDGWTCLCGEGWRGSQFCKCSDSPRYKALGNAVTVNVAEWLGRRILEAVA